MQKKSGLLTFLLACLPGAGQMYLGYMRRGLSFMLIFWGTIFVAAFFSFGMLCILLPVVWAYAFFDTFNLRAQAPECLRPDGFLVDPLPLLGSDFRKFAERRHTLFGGLLIFIGLYSLYSVFLEPILWDLCSRFGLDWLRRGLANLPMLLVAVLLIFFGARLVRGGDALPGPEEDYTAFKGGDGHDAD